jgi:hypothetical protein
MVEGDEGGRILWKSWSMEGDREEFRSRSRERQRAAKDDDFIYAFGGGQYSLSLSSGFTQGPFAVTQRVLIFVSQSIAISSPEDK